MYNGTLIKLGNYELPLRYIKAETYQVLFSTNDLDSYRDANGELHRNALDHKVAKVEFQTPPLLTNHQVSELMRNIQLQYTNAREKKLLVTMYIPEMDDYVTQEMYIPDIQFTIYGIFGSVIKYNAFRLAFIGY